MEKEEVHDLIIAALVIAFVFSYRGLNNLLLSIFLIPISLIVVSLGFIVHEMSHRTVARRFGAVAKFKMWNQGLFLAVILTFISNGNFIFAAPGAVYIFPRIDIWGHPKIITKLQNALISIAGPLSNVAIALASVAVSFLNPAYSWILIPMFQINMWLAIFNMIPVPPLDGHSIFSWNKYAWLISSIVFVLIFIFL